jgi:hypothetical protein
MARKDVRRPFAWLLLALLPAFGGWACKQKPKEAPAAAADDSAATSQAEKTRKMEAKAAEIERHAEEIRTMEGTEQEKIDAVNRLDKERKELADMQEDPGK